MGSIVNIATNAITFPSKVELDGIRLNYSKNENELVANVNKLDMDYYQVVNLKGTHDFISLANGRGLYANLRIK